MPKTTAGDYIGVRSRLIHIDGLIRKGDFPNQVSLAKRCGVSSKTVQRDLEYLQYNMSAPLRYDPARRGYYYTHDGFFLPLVFASGTDFQAIRVIGELVSQYEGTPLGELMDHALERMLSVFKNEDVSTVRQLAEKICFAGQPVVAIDKSVWENLLTALQRNQRVELVYLKGGNEPSMTRPFDPFGLIVRNRDWFVHGYCHHQRSRINLYVPYIASAKLLDDFFEIPINFHLASYAKSGFQGLQSEGHAVHKVELRFIPEVANAVSMHRFSHDQRLRRERTGHAVVTFNASALFQVEREVLSWGDKVEVVGPAILRQRICETAKAIAARNS